MSKAKEKNYRLDSIKMDQTYYTEEGYLVDHPVVTRCGIFEYAKPDGGIRRELRLPEEVFAEKSLASYEGKPIIITHEAGEVTKDNVSQEQIGTILSAGYRDGDNVRCKIVIHNTDALKKCGLKELSLGYGLNLDESPGTYKGEKYDAIQRDIEVNHLALVGEARAGDSARLNIDHKDTKKVYLKGGPAMAMKGKKKATKGADAPMNRRYDGDLTPEELEQAIALYKAQQASMEADSEEEETQNMDADEIISGVKERKDRRDSEEEQMDADEVIQEQEADIEALLNVIDELQAASDMTAVDEDDTVNQDEDEEATAADEDDLAADEDDTEQNADENEEKPVNMDSVDKLVGKRLRDYLDVCRIADRLNLDGVENMSLTAGRKKVIKAVNPKLNLDGKSDTYIKAAYDIAKQSVADRKRVDDQRRKMMNKSNYDSMDAKTVSAASASREKMMERRGKAGKK